MNYSDFIDMRGITLQMGIEATNTWTEKSITSNYAWYSVCWSPELGIFVAVNQSSAAVVMVSKM